MLAREPWSPYYRLFGLLLGVIALFVVGFAVLERDARPDSRVYLGNGRAELAAYLVSTPAP